MGFSLRCPDCRRKFPWEPTVAWPRFCPLCNADINNDRDDDDVVMPFMHLSGKTARTDQVYRDLEAASENRVQQAAEAAGVDASEMASLRITNLKDAKTGEISAPPIDNDITRHMARTGSDGWGGGNAREAYGAGTASGAVTVNGQVTQGIAPRAGMTAMSRLQSVLSPIPGTAAVRP